MIAMVASDDHWETVRSPPAGGKGGDMSNFTAIVDVSIGMSLIYLGVSLYVTIINEFIAQKLQLRGKQLAADLQKLIDEPNLKSALAANPALAPFLTQNGKPGSFVDPDIVARVLLGAARGVQTGVTKMDELIGAINALPDSELKKQLQALAQTASEDVEKFVGTVSHWVDQSLTMMGEVYKQRIKLISFLIGLFAAVAFNIQTLDVVSYLYKNKEAREAIAAVAEQFTDQVSKDTFKTCMDLKPEERDGKTECKPILGLVSAVEGGNETFGKLPIFWKGWEDAARQILPFLQKGVVWYEDWRWLLNWVGWLITGLAVSLGAPFWFDLLNKLVNIRRGVQPRKTG